MFISYESFIIIAHDSIVMNGRVLVAYSSNCATQVDYENASVKFLGWIVAAYSFGQLLASPFFGFWADKRPTREPLIIGLLIIVIFNVLYSYCGAFQSGLAGWIMLVSRAMVGFGAGLNMVVYVHVYMCAIVTHQFHII